MPRTDPRLPNSLLQNNLAVRREIHVADAVFGYHEKELVFHPPIITAVPRGTAWAVRVILPGDLLLDIGNYMCRGAALTAAPRIAGFVGGKVVA